MGKGYPEQVRRELDLKAEQEWPWWKGMGVYQDEGTACAKPGARRSMTCSRHRRRAVQQEHWRDTRKGWGWRGHKGKIRVSELSAFRVTWGAGGSPRPFKENYISRSHAVVQISLGILISGSIQRCLTRPESALSHVGILDVFPKVMHFN